jgi:regulator of replication initiation timing
VVRYLVIVGRGQPELSDHLTRQLGGDAKVLVMTDRRWTERRQRVEGHHEERRRRDRRQPHRERRSFETVTIVHLDAADTSAESRRASLPVDRPDEVHGLPHSTVNGTRETTTMDQITTHESRTQVIQWLDEGRHLCGLLPDVFHDLLSAEQECARLRQWLDECRAENDRLRSERTQLADALANLVNQMTQPVNEIVEKLRASSPRTP